MASSGCLAGIAGPCRRRRRRHTRPAASLALVVNYLRFGECNRLLGRPQAVHSESSATR